MPSSLSEPIIVTLRKVMDEVAHGQIQVPRFQRPFVWTDEQRLELMRSIVEKVPIGSLYLWETTTHHLPSYEKLGPHILQPPPPGPGVTRRYLLDGHQRLSTLYGALHAADRDPNDPDHWMIAYDLEAEDFVLNRSGWGLMPLDVILDGKALRRFQRELDQQAPPEKRGQIDVLIERSDHVSVSFMEYRIPLIPIVTESIEEATRTFKRINSSGTPMSEVHMVSALTWSPEFDLMRELDLICGDLPEKWKSIDKIWILRIIKGLSLSFSAKYQNSEIFSKKIISLSKQIKNDIIELCKHNIIKSVEFLEENFNITSHKSIPSMWQFVIISIILNEKIDKNLLIRWFWLTSLCLEFDNPTEATIAKNIVHLLNPTDERFWPNRRFLTRLSIANKNIPAYKAYILIFSIINKIENPIPTKLFPIEEKTIHSFIGNTIITKNGEDIEKIKYDKIFRVNFIKKSDLELKNNPIENQLYYGARIALREEKINQFINEFHEQLNPITYPYNSDKLINYKFIANTILKKILS